MRRFILLFFIAAPCTLAQAHKDPEGPAPPPLSEVIEKNISPAATGKSHPHRTEAPADPAPTDSAAPPHPNIKVIKKADVTMEEYSFNGKLYMVKVTPKIGKPYYLYDEEGSGNLIRHDDPHTHINPPRWTLFSW
jgi:hypothetical protein